MTAKSFIVEHLDDELGKWSELEYLAITMECHRAGARFCLSCLPTSLVLPDSLLNAPGLMVENESIEIMYADKKDCVCLLDPAAPKRLSPEDGDIFTTFLFGGILGDDPPRDRTSELRSKGYQGRNLGPLQMTTDTAVRVTRIVILEKKRLDEIRYNDQPEIHVNKNEKIIMPFRYVQDAEGNTIMPEGMLELIKKDSGKSLDDLF
ncbi:Protein arginine N-methyltransferase SFM1 [Golovinomyces cichoracearum]|uniref:Protein arginine N-methyltransferase SFM1 n=1 Tax=Golovinomyces cichoracearum TaxID=62708 RepID=A0A420J8K8_9PEZI|nr:Protein arginine N-methyltransferase SFM1 [Golovinomyces cichoracearum]